MVWRSQGITRQTIIEEFLILYKQDSYNPKRLTVKLVQSSSTYNYNDAVDGRVDSSPEGGSKYLNVYVKFWFLNYFMFFLFNWYHLTSHDTAVNREYANFMVTPNLYVSYTP